MHIIWTTNRQLFLAHAKLKYEDKILLEKVKSRNIWGQMCKLNFFSVFLTVCRVIIHLVNSLLSLSAHSITRLLSADRPACCPHVSHYALKDNSVKLPRSPTHWLSVSDMLTFSLCFFLFLRCWPLSPLCLLEWSFFLFGLLSTFLAVFSCIYTQHKQICLILQ